MSKVVQISAGESGTYEPLATAMSRRQRRNLPVQFSGRMDGKLWFYRQFNTKDVTGYAGKSEVRKGSSVSSPEYAWIRLHGKAVSG